MIRKYVRLRDRNQITLPAEILEGLGIDVGDFLEISRSDDDQIGIRPTELVIMNTARESEEAERALQPKAMAEAGEITSVEALQEHLKGRTKAGESMGAMRKRLERNAKRIREMQKRGERNQTDAKSLTAEEKLRTAAEDVLREIDAKASDRSKFAF